MQTWSHTNIGVNVEAPFTTALETTHVSIKDERINKPVIHSDSGILPRRKLLMHSKYG